MSSPYIEDRPWETCCDGERGCRECCPGEPLCWVCGERPADRMALDPAFGKVVPMCGTCEGDFESEVA